MFDSIENTIHVLLQTVNNALFMSIGVNSGQIGIPFLCCSNQCVMPYQYIIDILGVNFVVETENDNYSNYKNLGTTCNLYFVTAYEL